MILNKQFLGDRVPPPAPMSGQLNKSRDMKVSKEDFCQEPMMQLEEHAQWSLSEIFVDPPCHEGFRHQSQSVCVW